jgi:hypothetical protein
LCAALGLGDEAFKGLVQVVNGVGQLAMERPRSTIQALEQISG